ncbi:MAG TPA: caspase family protein [Hyphomonas sp.]|mgnify:CR=1 FL=1|nr:caspase family protein [Hyphomonas sp.]
MRLLNGLIALLLLCLPSQLAQAERRAFIVGVQDYDTLPTLTKTISDARGYAEVFGDMGFKVTLMDASPDRYEFIDSFEAFLDTIAAGDQVIIAYSGHGWSDGVENYLALSDAPQAQSQAVIRHETMALNGYILSEIRKRDPSLLLAIIDACRDNPFDTMTKSGSVTKGLVRMPIQKGELLIYSAGAYQQSLDRLSDDDPNPYSVFTRVLLPRLKDTQRPLADIVDEAGAETELLAFKIKHPQRPEMMLGIRLSFCLAETCQPRVSPNDEETDTWLRITSGRYLGREDCDAYRNYTDTYGETTGRFSEHAQRYLNSSRCAVPIKIVTDVVDEVPATDTCERFNQQFFVFFDFDRSNLTPDAAQVVSQAVDRASAGGTACSLKQAIVEGHTDTSLSGEYSLQMSSRMAQSVGSYLESLGVPAEKISATGYGGTRPVVPTGEGVREPLNRRVEVRLITGP